MTNMKLASETEVTVVVVGDSRYSFYNTSFSQLLTNGPNKLGCYYFKGQYYTAFLSAIY